MPANTAPRYTISGDFASNSGTTMAPTFTTAAADYTGATATHNKIVFTAGTNGSRIVGLHFAAIGTNTQSVARVFVNNGSAATTAANNSYVGALTLPATTASNTVAESSADFYFPGGYADLPANWTILVGLATTVAAGWVCTPILGGEF